MNVTLHNPRFTKDVIAPTSKSAAHRMLIAAAFADTPSRMRLNGAGEDIAATVRCLSAMGAAFREEADGEVTWLHISPVSVPLDGVMADCGESGSTLRFLVPVAAALGIEVTFLRRGRLPERPMSPLAEVLEAHGAHLTNNADGSLTVSGKLTHGKYEIAANVSSQFVTGLLFALSLLEAPSALTLTGEIESAPYIDMTVSALAAFGAAPAIEAGTRRYHIAGRLTAPLHAPEILLPEGDFSGAAFPLAAGAVGSHPVTVRGLDPRSLQGDKAILDLLRRFGADVAWREDGITVSPAPLRGIRIDARQIPDLVPVLAVVAATAEGVTHITGAARLRLKESDRIATTAALLRALGGKVTENEDGLTVEGTPLTGGTVDGAGDHRIVMSAAVAALRAAGDVHITGAEAVAKSYPTFFTLIHSAD